MIFYFVKVHDQVEFIHLEKSIKNEDFSFKFRGIITVLVYK
jgi:hypothetical protein